MKLPQSRALFAGMLAVGAAIAVPLDFSTGSLGALSQAGGTIFFDTSALTYSINGGPAISGGRFIAQGGTVGIGAFDFTSINLNGVTITASGVNALGLL